MRLLSSGEEDNQTSSDGEDVEEGRPRRAAVRPPGASSAPQKRSSLAHKGPLRGRRYPKPRAAARIEARQDARSMLYPKNRA